MTTPLTPKELESFCYQYNEPKGANYKRPWTRDGFTCATDGLLFIWMPAIEGVATNPAASDPRVLLSAFPAPDPDSFTACLPDGISVLDEWEPCPYCGGTGTFGMTDHSEECEDCHGIGKLPNMERQRIGSRLIATCLLVRMSRLPGVRIASGCGGPLHPLHFIFDGDGKGMVMPMKRHEDDVPAGDS